jgi:hypothetical protein
MLYNYERIEKLPLLEGVEINIRLLISAIKKTSPGAVGEVSDFALYNLEVVTGRNLMPMNL